MAPLTSGPASPTLWPPTKRNVLRRAQGQVHRAPEPITFTTGSEAGVVELPEPDAATCEVIYRSQACFDTGTPHVVEIEVDYPGEEPLYVLYSKDVDSWPPVTLWPRACGETIRYQTYNEDDDYLVKALGYNGMLYETDLTVSENEDSSGGCSLSGVGRRSDSGGWLLALGIGASLLARRRRLGA